MPFRKKNKNLGSPNLFSFKRAKFNPTPYVSCVIQYKKSGMTISAVLMMPFSIKMLKKKEKNTLKICAHMGIDPGPLASQPNMLTTRPLGQVLRRSKLPYK